MNNIWLSVIIPAYNCRDTIERLLDSICIQDTEGTEIIICDDNSTDNFMEKVEPYKDKLNIIYAKTKERDIHCPGNTRMDGFEKAIGEWVTFIDNDDLFEENVFNNVKAALEISGETRLLQSPFREYYPESDSYGLIIDNGITWMHGKFYNRQFLLNNNIHFEENLKSHEDLYFNTQLLSYFRSNNLDYTIMEYYTYKWVFNPNSISRSYNKTNHSFIECNFKDYIYAGTEAWFECYKTHNEMRDFIFKQLSSVVLYSYFYYQSFMYSEKEDDIIKENLSYIKYLVYRIIFEFNVSGNDIIDFIHSDPKSYRHIYNECISGNCDFIEMISFKDFMLNLIL